MNSNQLYLVKEEGSVFNHLCAWFQESSKRTIRQWLKVGRICVDGVVVHRTDHLVHPGQKLTLSAKTQQLSDSVKILYQDKHIVVLIKPEGMLSVATDFEKGTSIHDLLKRQVHTRRVYPVHRLDRDTSGVMLFAYTKRDQEALKKQFEEHLVDKSYVAIVEGKLDQNKGSWESDLKEDPTYFVRSCSKGQGKLAVTHYEQMQSTSSHSLVVLRPKTGRKNQLRVHCSESGHPVAGDQKYGAKTSPIGRLCLHAHKIGFCHPHTEKAMRFSVPVPTAFSQVLKGKL